MSDVSPTPPKAAVAAYRHETLAVIFQVREQGLCVLLWQRAQDPQSGRWALPGGFALADADFDASIRTHLATKVDVRQLTHLEQLETYSTPHRTPRERVIATGYMGIIPAPAQPGLPADTRWYHVDNPPPLAFDHEVIIAAARHRLRSKLSYTNLGFALTPPTFTLSELATYYSAALGHEVDATNLHRILNRRNQIEATGEHSQPGRCGGRPAALYRFTTAELYVTDAFAVLAPPSE